MATPGAKLSPHQSIFDGRYIIGQKVSSGSFGDVYMATDSFNGETVAIKLESVKTARPLLRYESLVYKHLRKIAGIPTVECFGQARLSLPSKLGAGGLCYQEYNVMVMQLLGPSLEELFSYCGRKFSLKTVLMIADQMLQRVEHIHTHSFLHRDIKPDNFLMGLDQLKDKLFVIDFGLAKKYRHPITDDHISYREEKTLTGTARYASLYAHKGIEQGRRDDLESIGFVLIYFLRGSLPWQGIHAENKKQKYDKILEVKRSISFEELCKGFPLEFYLYLEYCRGLTFAETPDYSFLLHSFRYLFRKLNLQFDYDYDWNTIRAKKD